MEFFDEETSDACRSSFSTVSGNDKQIKSLSLLQIKLRNKKWNPFQVEIESTNYLDDSSYHIMKFSSKNDGKE